MVVLECISCPLWNFVGLAHPEATQPGELWSLLCFTSGAAVGPSGSQG